MAFQMIIFSLTHLYNAMSNYRKSSSEITKNLSQIAKRSGAIYTKDCFTAFRIHRHQYLLLTTCAVIRPQSNSFTIIDRLQSINTLFLILLSTSLFSQSAGTIQQGLSGASLFNQDPFMSYNNSGLAMKEEVRSYLGLYVSKPYNIPDLAGGGFGGQFRLNPSNTIGGGLLVEQHYLGSQRFTIFTGYNLRLSKNIHAGIGGNYTRSRYISWRESVTNRVLVQTGMSYKFHPDWLWTWQVENIHAYDPYRKNIPFHYSSFRTGLQYSLGKQINLLGEINYIDRRPLTIKLGMQYKPSDKFLFLAGISNYKSLNYDRNIMIYSFGMGFTYKKIQVMTAFGYHAYLGSTPNAGLYYTDLLKNSKTIMSDEK